MCQNKISKAMCQLFVIWLFLVVAFKNGAGGTSDACWSSEQECVIQATLQQAVTTAEAGHDFYVPIVPINIDCMSNLYGETNSLSHEEMVTPTSNVYTMRRFERAQNVTLDGCHTPLRASTYGFEHLPNCDRITQITIKRFHNDVLQHLYCPASAAVGATLQTEVLHIQSNDIATFAGNSFRNLANLRELYVTQNSLRHIERNAFDELRGIELIQLKDEPLLAIKEPGLFERTAAIELSLTALKWLTPQLLEQLPESLRQIEIVQTPIETGAVRMTNRQQLRNISIIGCALSSFALDDLHSGVLHLNLSGNVITHFEVANVSALETLDLSENKLTHLPLEWLGAARQLRRVVLHGNMLRTLSLTHLLEAVPSAHLIDLSGNRLMALTTDGHAELDCDHTRIQIDRNPFSCKWLLDFAHSQPENFRIFQYNKFISQINVNGLECRVEEPEVEVMHTTIGHKQLEDVEGMRATSTSAPRQVVNVSTYTLVYGNEWDFKRGQRAEALVIVFMLPLGIAFLFVLLYLWLYCEKLFHWSYYSSAFMCGGSDSAATRLTAERFDVVRQLPPGIDSNNTSTTIGNINGGYETPLNGIISACNCNNIGEKCRKAHHVTYEAPPPSEQPYKIYEEIVEGDDVDDDNDADLETAPQLRHMRCAEAHPFYDHLMFVRPEEKDVCSELPNP